jgi:hypothetical protein
MSYLPGLEPAVPPSLPDGDGDEWYTPRKVLDAVAALAADGIDLDPCYAPRSLVDARHVIDARSGGDGLRDSWPGDGLVWCNPPYSDVEPWLRRCCNASVSRDVVLLIPMRPETKAWQQWVWGSGAVVVIHTGRLSFVATDGTIRTESDLQRAILLRIGALPGVYVARTAATACYQPDGRGGYRLHRPLPAGWPDLTAVVGGRAVAIEVKSPGLRRQDGTAPLRPAQDSIRRAWEAAGGLWITASALEDVDCLVGMARAPVLADGRGVALTELRPYQQTALTDARQAYRDGARRVLMVAPTGAGKTVIAATAIAAQQQRAAASSSSRRAARLWRRPRPS